MPRDITLFTDNKDCCGCGACCNICPKKAITMSEDKYGFIYPEIDRSKCIGCGLCMKACGFQNSQVTNEPMKAFAASAKSDKIIKKSASGGAFAAIASNILDEGGAVFGAAFDGDHNVYHTGVDRKEKLSLLQGSKYVQSNTANTYKQVRDLMNNGKKVLYSGTPCQIAGLYGFLGRDYDRLITVDLICHGVPNQKMFRDYIKSLGIVKKFSFRDKSIGWGINGSAIIEKNGSDKKIKLWQSASAYLYYFSQGEIYRESCYSCKYACSHRPADITLGDYWGIEKQHPEYLGKEGFDESKGISVVIANTEKGLKTLNECSNTMHMLDSEFSKAAAGNTQLRKPSSHSQKRSELLELYADKGWNAVEERYKKNIGVRKYSSQVKSLIPKGVKKYLKRMK